MSKYKDITVPAFAETLASKAPAPGGGGASALVGALAAALGEMAGSLTLGKKKYADVEPEIIEMMGKAEELREKLLSCIDEDAEAFEPLSAIYGIPKDTPGRDEKLELALRDAASVPHKIMLLSAEVIALNKEFSEKASKLVISDAATGASLARAALTGAYINVLVNTRLMKDREYADALESDAKELVETYGALADDICAKVIERL